MLCETNLNRIRMLTDKYTPDIMSVHKAQILLDDCIKNARLYSDKILEFKKDNSKIQKDLDS